MRPVERFPEVTGLRLISATPAPSPAKLRNVTEACLSLVLRKVPTVPYLPTVRNVDTVLRVSQCGPMLPLGDDRRHLC